MPGIWDAPPTEEEVKGAGVFDAPPTPEEMGEKPTPDTSVGASLLSGVGRGAWAVPGLLGLDHAKAQALYQYVKRKIGGEDADLGALEASQRAGEAAREAAHPILTGIGIGVGATPAAAVLPVVAPASGAGLAARSAAGAISGAAQGAALEGGLSSGAPVGERLARMGTAAAMGGALGALAPGAPVGALPRGELSTAAGEMPTAGLRDQLADFLRRKAGERNIKAAGGIQSDIVRARKQLGPGGANDGRAALTEIGAEMGDKGLVSALSTPEKTFARSAELMDDAGSRMGRVLAEADAAGGARPTVSGVLDKGDAILAALQKNPHTASSGDPEHAAMGHSMGNSAADQFAGLLARYRRIYGDRPLTFSEAHEIRTNISKDLYGMRGTKDPWADAYKDALHDFRSAVSGEIERNLDAATSNTAAWKTANRDYQVASKALEFADKGMDRAHGNNQVSPTELLAGLGGMAGMGAATGSTVGGGLGGLALYGATALSRRHGAALQGALAGNLSRAIRPGAEAPALASRIVDPEVAAFIAALRAPHSRLAGAAADEEENR